MSGISDTGEQSCVASGCTCSTVAHFLSKGCKCADPLLF
jgi:hypothetical protein